MAGLPSRTLWRYELKVTQRDLLLLLLVFLLVYLVPLSFRPLFIPDETRYAEIPREMISTGSWVVPHLNGLQYFEKPVFGYWVHAVSQLVFGETRFAIRFPSALSTGLCALLVLFLTQMPSRIDPRRSLGSLATLIFFSMIAVAGIGTFTVLDNVLTLFLAFGLDSFFWASESTHGSWRERGFLVVTGVACGLAFMTKGFLAIAVPALVFAGYLVWQKRWLDLLRMSWLPLLTAFLVSLPWSLSVHFQAPDYWNYFFWEEHIKRFFSVNGKAQHGQPAYFFLAVLPAMILPWTFLLPVLWKGMRKKVVYSAQQKNLNRYALCWFVLPFLFFSYSSGKLMTYILPCFPAIAILIAFNIDRLEESFPQKIFNKGAIFASVVWALVLVTLLVLQVTGIDGGPLYSRPEAWILGSLSLLCGIFIFIKSVRSVTTWRKLVLFSLAPMPLLMAAPMMMPDKTLEIKAPGIFFEEMHAEISPSDLVFTEAGVVTAVCWSWKRDDLYLLNRGELEYGLNQPAGQKFNADIAQMKKMIDENPGKVVLVAREKKYVDWVEQLPTPSKIYEDGEEGVRIARY